MESFLLAPLFLQSFTMVGNDWAGHLWQVHNDSLFVHVPNADALALTPRACVRFYGQVSAFALCYALYPWLLARLQRHSRRGLLLVCAACYILPLIILVCLSLRVVYSWPSPVAASA